MLKSSHERVLDAVAVGERTRDELQALTGLSDERLGLALSELFDARKIWTRERGGERVYGLERRLGLSPRLPHLLRRSTDRVWGTR
ncbi:MAG TPA: hypothetical protein VIP46_18490 [Pyrinomonadaceae bacterium]